MLFDFLYPEFSWQSGNLKWLNLCVCVSRLQWEFVSCIFTGSDRTDDQCQVFINHFARC